MSKALNVDVVIVGGGMVGLVLAAALVRNRFKVAIIESKKPTLSWPDKPCARVSAINVASINILKNLEIWRELNKKSISSLMRLKVWDSIGGGEIEFDSAEMGAKELGCIVENREIIRAAWQQLEKNSDAHLFCDQTPAELNRHERSVEIFLQDKQCIKASLCVGADGDNSWVRDQIHSEMKMRSYQQNAIVAVVETELLHQSTGWQAFSAAGPLALLPLQNPNQCAIVWSQTCDRAKQLMAMDELDFECELNNEFGLRLGHIKYLHDRRAFPLVMRHVAQYVDGRVVLIGDAAHTIHPLAGQGVNLGFLDAAALAQCLNDARHKQQDIGNLKSLRRYERWRRGDNAEMICAMRGFSDLFMTSSTVTVQLRSHGFNLVDKMPWLKKQFMRVALGKKSDLPNLAMP